MQHPCDKHVRTRGWPANVMLNRHTLNAQLLCRACARPLIATSARQCYACSSIAPIFRSATALPHHAILHEARGLARFADAGDWGHLTYEAPLSRTPFPHEARGLSWRIHVLLIPRHRMLHVRVVIRFDGPVPPPGLWDVSSDGPIPLRRTRSLRCHDGSRDPLGPNLNRLHGPRPRCPRASSSRYAAEPAERRRLSASVAARAI